jgi:hypothetical protein
MSLKRALVVCCYFVSGVIAIATVGAAIFSDPHDVVFSSLPATLLWLAGHAMLSALGVYSFYAFARLVRAERRS